MRLSVGQARASRLPQTLGLCAGDLPGLLSYLNECDQRLIIAGGDTGFWGGWAKIVFNVAQSNPYFTLPRQYSRAINLDVCRTPIKLQNEFYETLVDGIGLQDRTCPIQDWCGNIEGFERGVVSTMVDLTPTNQKLRVYPTDPADVETAARVLICGAIDQNGNPIYSQDSQVPVPGEYITVDSPFGESADIITSFSGIQKDVTFGDLVLKQVDATTGTEVTLARYGADETAPAYRRYFISRIPACCCVGADPNNTQITAMVKYEHVELKRDTDFMVIGNLPAVIEECQAIRYSSIDSTTAAGLEIKHHKKAISLLNQELNHYLGKYRPAVVFAPFGGARLERQKVGSLI